MRMWIEVCLISGFLVGSAFGQAEFENAEKMLEQERSSFPAAFQKIVGLYKNKDWGAVYELFPPAQVQERRDTRAEFIRRMESASTDWVLEESILAGVQRSYDLGDARRWNFFACSTERNANSALRKRERWVGSAYYYRGNWYFDLFTGIVEIDAGTVPCEVAADGGN